MPDIPAIRVSDHVLLRYIERHYGIKTAPIRNEIHRLAAEAVVTGAVSIVWNELRLVVNPDRYKPGCFVVATALEKHMNFKGMKMPNGKFRLSDRSEGRRISHQKARRLK